MPSVTARNALVSAYTANATWVSVHTGPPGVNGANEVAGGPYARKQSTFGAPAAGTVTGSQVSVDVPAGGPYTHWGLWTAVSGGTFYDGGELNPDETFAGVGILRVTPTVNAP